MSRSSEVVCKCHGEVKQVTNVKATISRDNFSGAHCYHAQLLRQPEPIQNFYMYHIKAQVVSSVSAICQKVLFAEKRFRKLHLFF